MDDYREHWLDGSPHHGVPWCATFPRRDPNAPAVSLMAGVEGFCLRDYEDMASQALTLCEFEGDEFAFLDVIFSPSRTGLPDCKSTIAISVQRAPERCLKRTTVVATLPPASIDKSQTDARRTFACDLY